MMRKTLRRAYRVIAAALILAAVAFSANVALAQDGGSHGGGGAHDDRPSGPNVPDPSQPAPGDAPSREQGDGSMVKPQGRTQSPAHNLKPISIRVGTDASYRPMEYIDSATNEIVGFDIDLMKAIGEATNMEIEFVNIPFDGIFLATMNGTVNCTISSITITDERKQSMNFSEPYYRSAQALLVPVKDADKYKAIADMKQARIGVQLGTTGQFLMEKESESEHLSKYDTVPLIIGDLKNGNLDVAMIDLPVAKYYAQAETDGGEPIFSCFDGNFSEEYYGICVPKSETALLERINLGLAIVKENGTLARIEDTWF